MTYYYFISGIIPKTGSSNYFNTEVGIDKKITSIQDITNLSKRFAEIVNAEPDHVIILNYQLLRIE